ncbi:MAG TPA: hypothetical protein VGI48_11110 [Caldimonas sp.]|jgi:hypothetical protein
MDLKPASDEREDGASRTAAAEPPTAVRVAAKAPFDSRATRLDVTWLASSFDLAQGLDVKVMQSKLSAETLDRLFRG